MLSATVHAYIDLKGELVTLTYVITFIHSTSFIRITYFI